jgi:eukaryotic-like serine/threonine-protein kinase
LAEFFPIRFGRYELTERLALGGMAEVFLASVDGEHGFARNVVIKRLLPHLAREPGYTAMFIDEAKLTARLVHPKIAQTYELGRVGDQLFIAMELIDGVDVLALLRELATRDAHVPFDLAVWIAHEVLDALDYAHQLTDAEGRPMGVVHRDVSPSNVLLSRRGDVKLVDFGIAHASEPGRHHRTKSGTLKGKYGYMSPEQVLEQPVDARSDLFSVGIVLAEMLCGRRLFAAPNELDVLLMVRDARLDRLDEHGRHLEPDLDRILRKALRKDRDERWSSAGEMRDALDDWLYRQRLRITPRRVADLVDGVYDPIWARRRAASAVDLPLLDGVVPAGRRGQRAPTSSETPRALRGPGHDDVDGIPRGEVIDHSMPVVTVEEPPVVEVAMPGRLKVTIPPLAPRPSLPPVEPRPVRPRTITDDEFDRALAGLDDLGGADPEELELPLGDSTGAPTAAAPDQPSIRYASIEAAVSALARKDPDPSTVEFDGRDVGPPRRTGELPKLTAAALRRAATAPPPELVTIDDTPAGNGDFAATPPLRVLYRMASGRQTGLLVARVGEIVKEIYFRDGVPEYVSSNVSTELLGNWLVQQGVLSAGELAMALAMMPHYGGRLGDTLVGLGLLKPLEVFRHLTRQVRQKLIDVCTWSAGRYSWYANRQNPREAFPLDLDAFEVLGAGAIEATDEVVAGWLRRWGDVKLRVSKGRLGPERFQVAGLRALYDSLDGRRTVGEMLDRYTDDAARARAARMLLLLELCELVRAAA